MAKGKITKRTIDSLVSQDYIGFVWDLDTKGFGAKFTKSGAISYVVQYRMGGREAATRRYTIGRHGSPWTPTTARTEAERLLILVAQGRDPVEADILRRREAVDLTFSNYADLFGNSVRGEGWTKMVKRSLRLHVKPILKNKPLPQITRSDIAAVLDAMPVSQIAKRRDVFAVIRRMFRWAVSRGDLERSPTEGMETPPPVTPRERWLADDELKRIWKHAPTADPCFGPIVRLLIVTGQRREEVSRIAWEELDRAEKLWTLPGTRTKNGKANTIPLNDLAIRVLDDVAGGAQWPGHGRLFLTSRGGSFTSYHKGKLKVDSAIAAERGFALPPWRLHDLRRTLATNFQRLGVRFEVTEAVLNHVGLARSGVAGIYQRHDWRDEKRAALEAWNDHLSQIIAADSDVGSEDYLRLVA